MNINNSLIDLAYLTVCFKEFLDKSQLVLNDLEKKYSNSGNSELHEAFKINNNNNKSNYIAQKKELISEKISNNDKSLKIGGYFGNHMNFNNIDQIEKNSEALCKFSNKINKEINQMLVNLIYFEFIEYNSVSFIYFYNIIKLMKINEDKNLDKLSQMHLLESKAIEIQNNDIKQFKINIKSLQNELNNKNKQLKEAKKRERELEKENQLNYENFHKEKEVMKKDIENLKNQNEKIKAENGTIKKEYSTIKEENAAIKEENATIKKEYSTIKDENASIKKEYSTIKEENATIKKEYSTIKEENATIKKEYLLIKEENIKINSDFENLIEKQETKDKRNEEKFILFEKEMNEKFELLNQECEGLKLEMLQRNDFTNYIKDINNKLIKNSLNNSKIIETYSEQISHLTNDNYKYVLENINLKRDINILKNEKETMSAYISQKNLDEEFKNLKNN